ACPHLVAGHPPGKPPQPNAVRALWPLQAVCCLPMVAATGLRGVRAQGKDISRMGAKVGGGGGSKFDLGQNADMNVTPFVDVMLVLLIIFMVSIPAATVSIKLDLPPAIPPPPGTK